MATSPATHPEVESDELHLAEDGGRALDGGSKTFLLEGISWRTYESLLRDFEEAGSNVRMTYDRGRLELMSPAYRHEDRKKRVARMIEAMTEELNIPVACGGSTTLRRELLERGLEPDECYWIAHEAEVRDLENVELDSSPPPDLAIEVENTRRLADRLGVYAGLGFPEVWRIDAHHIQIGHLGADGSYNWGESSGVFPFLVMADFERFLERIPGQGVTRWMRGFRAWVRETLAPQHARPDDDPPA